MFGTKGAFSLNKGVYVAIVEAVYHVINMSLIGHWSSASIRMAIQFVTEQDVIVVI